MAPVIVLVDMDGVLADFEIRFLEIWRTRFPNRPFIPLEHRTTFSLRDQYPEEHGDDVRDIWTSPGFFRGLPPIVGGRQALEEMAAAGHEVFLCTSPLLRWENCVPEKYAWAADHLGEAWTRRMILTRDKTVVAGDVLVDDKPSVEGVSRPSWEHVVFDQPYNRGVKARRLTSWRLWREVLGTAARGDGSVNGTGG